MRESDLHSSPAGFGKRKPDVVICKIGQLKHEVHLVEGKLLNVPADGLEETLNQLDSFRPYVRGWRKYSRIYAKRELI
jgi:hypothetical protein